MFGHRTGPLLIVVLAVLTLSLAAGRVTAQIGPSDAAISFLAPLGDADVRAFVDDRGVQLTSLHASVLGLTGSYRSYANISSAALVRDARESTITTFTNSLGSSAQRLRAFTGSNSTAQVASDAGLQTQLRSLLNIRAKLQRAIALLTQGTAVIYAIDVNATPTQLAALGSDWRVRAVAAAGDLAARQDLKPAALEVTWSDSEIDGLDAPGLYTRALVEGGR
ncbi:MAG: hypothetical protein QOG34_1192 [Frankiaceae bacterium]|jgi:hypothetical protein|nr:hypothetical protein [Frankiaceae bacterium]